MLPCLTMHPSPPCTCAVQIVDCGALPILIQMLRSEDVGVHYEAVGVIGNLVHSSQNIKRKVLEEGALQPVISLLSSTCAESQREAALLLGQFATTDADTKVGRQQTGCSRAAGMPCCGQGDGDPCGPCLHGLVLTDGLVAHCAPLLRRPRSCREVPCLCWSPCSAQQTPA